MNEADLRAMVRASIARQLGGAAAGAEQERVRLNADATHVAGATYVANASFVRLPLPSGGDDQSGVCLIEPAVRCSHCGYCQSYGH
jgi:hypothetical protein